MVHVDYTSSITLLTLVTVVIDLKLGVTASKCLIKVSQLTLSLCNVIKSIGKLKMLVYLDMSKNRIETVDMDISGCEALEDLLLSSNMLQQLPDSIGENIIFCHECWLKHIIFIFISMV